MEQRTDEWFEHKLGRVSASRIADVMAKTKSGYSTSRKNYMAQLAVERLTGQREETYINAAMQRGIDEEDLAISEYEAHTDSMVELVGFVDHPTIPMSGASPDGYVGEDGLVEIKNPNTATHIETLITKKVERKYVLQMHWQMMCTGRKWCDFASHDSRMPAGKRLVVIRTHNPILAAEIEKEVRLFLLELDALVKAIEEME